jgi:phosphomannomutase
VLFNLGKTKSQSKVISGTKEVEIYSIDNAGRVLIRASGMEPVIRVMMLMVKDTKATASIHAS